MLVFRLKVIVLIFFTSCGASEQSVVTFENGSVFFVEQKMSIEVQVAETEQQRTLGLMHRKQLDEHKGMLFVFDQLGVQRVWMKNTLIPLDVIFISAEGRVVSMLKELLPCKKQKCEIHDSKTIAKYMLEVNSGLVEQNNINVGNTVEFLISL